MTETYKPWTDANGRYFDWLEELWALEAERKPRSGHTQESLMMPVSELRLPTLSFLVDCLEAIRGNLDLMGRISDLARRYPMPDQLPEQESRELAHLVRMFITWFELKRESGQGRTTSPPMNTTASGFLYGILYEQERRILRCSDAEAIRQEILPGFSSTICSLIGDCESAGRSGRVAEDQGGTGGRGEDLAQTKRGNLAELER